MNKRAVIVRAGPNSQHSTWADPSVRSFDLLLPAYAELPLKLKSIANDYAVIPGSKVQGWSNYLKSRPHIYQKYESIAFIDDDIEASAADINKVFELGEKNNMKIWQPSLSWDSFFSYGISLRNPLFKLRYVNYVEMMCPFFSCDQLQITAPLFDLGYETGIDRLWCRLHEDWKKSYGIIDEVCVQHGRKVGLLAAQQGFSNHVNAYQEVLNNMEHRSGTLFRGPVAYSGLMKNGRNIQSRYIMSLISIVPILALSKSPNRGWFVRPVLDHVRHNLTRPINNEKVEISEVFENLGPKKLDI